MEMRKLLNKLQSNKVLVVLVVIVLVALASVLYYFSTNKQAEKNIVLYGNVDLRQVALAFNSVDRINSLKVEEGSIIKKGQVVATLDTRETGLQISKIKAQIEAQESNLLRLKNGSRPEEIAQQKARWTAAVATAEYTKLQEERVNSAFNGSEGRSVSVQTRDSTAAENRAAQARAAEAEEAYQLVLAGPRAEDIAEAEAQLKSLRADLALKEFALSQAELVAPVDGVIRSRLAEVGDMVSPQKPVFLVAVDEVKWVRAYLEETQLGKVKPGMEATLIIDSYPDSPLQGVVGFISSVAEFTPKTVQTESLRTSLLYEVRIQVKDEENLLRMGMPVTVYLKIDDYRGIR